MMLSADARFLVFDTETTGVVDQAASAEDAGRQPEIVQFACLLIDDKGQEWASANLIVDPSGIVPDAAARVHGLTTDICRVVGVSPMVVLHLYQQLAFRSTMLVAHNLEFDDTVMRAAYARCGRRQPDRLAQLRRVCTKVAATPVLNLPPTEKMRAAGLDKPKPPTLAETYEHLFGQKLLNAHSAMDDTRACARIFLNLLQNGHIR